MLGDPKDCKQRALLCAERARNCQSPEARQKFADLAQTWLLLAVQLEEQWALIDEWGSPPKNAKLAGKRLNKLSGRRIARSA